MVSSVGDNTRGGKLMDKPVVIQMYHNNPPTRPISESGEKGTVWCSELWDHEAEEAARWAAGWDGSIGPKMLDEAQPVVDAVYQRMVVDDLKREGLDVLEMFPYGNDTGAAVFVLRGNRDTLVALAEQWSTELVAEMNGGIGGDDSYFDYFPDYCDGLHQLCKQINYPDAWNTAKELLEAPGAPYDPDNDISEDNMPSRL
jgi:hypothetical protein